MTVRPLVAAVIALAPAAFAAAAHATTETAADAGVQATFSYTKVTDFEWQDLRVEVTRDGAPAFDGVPSADGCQAPYCAPSGEGVGGSSLDVADLDGDGEPEITVDLYTGGAHCCEISYILRWTGAGYVPTTHDWGDPGYSLDIPTEGGPTTFVTADDRFAYAFASFADSGFPVQLLAFRGGAFKDVTRAHRAAVLADAARWAKEYKNRRKGRFALGVLAAYIADEYRLGRRHKADAVLAHELRAGRLRGIKPWPTGKAYIKALKKSLRAWGYAE